MLGQMPTWGQSAWRDKFLPYLSLRQTDRQTNAYMHDMSTATFISSTKTKQKITLTKLSSFYTQKSMAVRLQNTSHTAWTNTVHGSTRVTHIYGQWKHTSHTHLWSDTHVTIVTETTGTILFCFTVGSTGV